MRAVWSGRRSFRPAPLTGAGAAPGASGAGKGGGAFKTGRHVRYPDDTTIPNSPWVQTSVWGYNPVAVARFQAATDGDPSLAMADENSPQK